MIEETLGNRKKPLVGKTMMNPVEDSKSSRTDAETGETIYEGSMRESFPGVKLKTSNRVEHNTIEDVITPYKEQAEELKESRRHKSLIRKNDEVLESREESEEEETEEVDVGNDYREKVTGMIKGISEMDEHHPGQQMGVKSGKYRD